MKVVYIDESGHTGADLLNINQSVFALGALVANTEVYEKVLGCFPRFRMGELKHKFLHKRGRHDDQLLEALGILLGECLTISFVEPKLYGLIESFLYDCVCPLGGMFEYGSSDYSKLAMMLFRLPEMFGGDEFMKLMGEYQSAIRDPHGKLGYLLSMVASIKSENLIWVTDGLRARRREVMKSFSKEPAPSLQVSSLFSVVTQLELQMDDEYRVIYDNAGDIDEYADSFMTFCNSRCGKIRVATGVEVDFPLTKFRGLQTADSKVHKCLQLADLLAGSVNYACRYVIGALDDPADISYGKHVMELFVQIPDNRFLFKPTTADEYISKDIKSLRSAFLTQEAQ